MSGTALWKLSVRTSSEAEQAVSELLAQICGLTTSSFTNFETRQTDVSVYLPRKSDWSFRARRQLQGAMAWLGARGMDVGPARISLTKLVPQNWAESWKRHFKPIEISSALLIRPSWSSRSPRRGQSVVTLDPGLSFGTGQHPTTLFCLRQLAARRRPLEAQSALDLGTGSGILAICAAKLGYAPIDALENDPEALRIARANARLNGVLTRVRFVEGDVTEMPRRAVEHYSVICANLISDLLIEARLAILNRLSAEGVLVAAGILKSEFSQVHRAYRAAGLRLIAQSGQKEWRSGAFAWRKN